MTTWTLLPSEPREVVAHAASQHSTASYRILKELEAGANSKMDIMIGRADASYLPPRDELLEAVLMIGNAEGSARSAPKSLLD